MIEPFFDLPSASRTGRCSFSVDRITLAWSRVLRILRRHDSSRRSLRPVRGQVFL